MTQKMKKDDIQLSIEENYDTVESFVKKTRTKLNTMSIY